MQMIFIHPLIVSPTGLSPKYRRRAETTPDSFLSLAACETLTCIWWRQVENHACEASNMKPVNLSKQSAKFDCIFVLLGIADLNRFNLFACNKNFLRAMDHQVLA